MNEYIREQTNIFQQELELAELELAGKTDSLTIPGLTPGQALEKELSCRSPDGADGDLWAPGVGGHKQSRPWA